jgi:hypothetical protein
MAGTVIGAVGAIGGLAAGAGLFGSGADAPLFGPAPTSAAAADAGSSGTVNFVAGDASDADIIPPPDAPPGGVGTVDPATGDVITQATGADVPPPSGGDTLTLASTTQNDTDPAAALASTKPIATADATTGGTTGSGLINSSANPADAVAPGTTGTSTSTSTVPGLSGPGTTAANPTPVGGSGLSAQANPELNTAGGATESSDTSSSILSKLVDYAGAHPVVALGAIQAGGSFLTGAFSSLTPAQTAQANAQAAANDAAAALTKQQTANLAMPKSVASSAPVTGAPRPLVPQQPPGQTGLINRAPAQPQVTGKAA